MGSHGSGFLSDPAQIKSQLAAANVLCTSVEKVTGAPPDGFIPESGGFPSSLGPLGLVAAESTVNLTVHGGLGLQDRRDYKINTGLEGSMLDSLKTKTGSCSPRAPMPTSWPGAPDAHTRLQTKHQEGAG